MNYYVSLLLAILPSLLLLRGIARFYMPDSVARIVPQSNYLGPGAPLHILYYTSFWGRADWGTGLGAAAFQRAGCPEARCLLSQRGGLKPEEADAILFHSTNAMQKGPDQKKRRRSQVYVFAAKESPLNDRHIQWEKYSRNYFNWTMSYRAQADIPFAYGWLEPLEPGGRAGWPEPGRRASWLEPRPASTALARPQPRSGLVAWLASNCHTPSKREDYVKQLQKHIPVHIYGKCGRPLNCTRSRDKCFGWIADRYKFYLAFENSICHDYATEKLYRTLGADIVPVVLGGANYTALAPPRSFINVADFASPGQLARELVRLAGSEEEYRSYFWWKEHYRVQRVKTFRGRALCQLCAALHSARPASTYSNLMEWLAGTGQCSQLPV